MNVHHLPASLSRCQSVEHKDFGRLNSAVEHDLAVFSPGLAVNVANVLAAVLHHD